MNIKAEGYTEEQLIAALFSSARQVRYEYTVMNSAGAYLGKLEVDDAVISFDSTSAVMRTLTGTVIENDIFNRDSIDYQIIPWMCLMMFNNKEAKFPLGRFIVTSSLNYSNNITKLNINGYDLGKVALDDKTSGRFFASSDNTYEYALRELLEGIYPDIDITEITSYKSFSQEWEPGTSKLTIANDLLRGVNYNPLYFNENGHGVCEPYILPEEKGIDFQYIADKTSIIVDDIAVETNVFDIPNKWIRYTENADTPYLISIVVNDNPDSPYSTVSRNRFIVDTQVVEDIASQAELNAYTKRIASKSMQRLEKVTFYSLNMPGHNYRELLWLNVPSYNIEDRYIETAWQMDLKPGGLMTHVCEKVVVI